jgi:GNAT superfamily N-acetyltransferase
VDVTFRLGTDEDALSASRIIDAALNDLNVRQGRPPLSGSHDEAAPALRHLTRTDGDRFWLACAAGTPVAVGAAFVRGLLSFLGALFVLPEWQGKGVGRALLEKALEGQPPPGGVTALTSSAANPLSNGLYSRHGIYALCPLLTLEGRLDQLTTRPHLGTLEVEPLRPTHIAELTEIDAVVTGTDRSVDHRWLIEEPGHGGWVFRRGGRAVGYAYVGGDGTEGEDVLGPVATLRPQDQSVVLRYCLAELAARGRKEAVLMVPGVNLEAQRLLWQAGFALDGPAGLLCASRPFGRFDRYVLAGDCLM